MRLSKNNFIFTILGTVFLVLSSCTSSIRDVDVGKYKNEDFLIYSEGSGKNIDEAKKNAITALGQIILVNVKSTLSSSEVLDNNNYSIHASSDIILNSSSNFKGVIYYNISRGGGTYSIYAGLSKSSYQDTVSYFSSIIAPENINIISSRPKLAEELEKVNFLLALISYGKSVNISFDNSKYNNLINYSHELTKRVNADAELRFNVIPDDKSIRIIFDNNINANNETIYINKGTYFYNISATGYVPRKGRIDLYQGDKKNISVYLQKKLEQSIPVMLDIINESNLSTSYISNFLRNMASNNQMIPRLNASNKLKIELGETNVNHILNDYYSINTNVNLTFHGETGIEKSTSFVVNYLSKNDKAKIPDNVFANAIQDNTDEFWGTLYN